MEGLGGGEGAEEGRGEGSWGLTRTERIVWRCQSVRKIGWAEKLGPRRIATMDMDRPSTGDNEESTDRPSRGGRSSPSFASKKTGGHV